MVLSDAKVQGVRKEHVLILQYLIEETIEK